MPLDPNRKGITYRVTLHNTFSQKQQPMSISLNSRLIRGPTSRSLSCPQACRSRRRPSYSGSAGPLSLTSSMGTPLSRLKWLCASKRPSARRARFCFRCRLRMMRCRRVIARKPSRFAPTLQASWILRQPRSPRGQSRLWLVRSFPHSCAALHSALEPREISRRSISRRSTTRSVRAGRPGRNRYGNAVDTPGSFGWEFGCNKDPKQKAEHDYAARVTGVSAADQKNTTFVFVTPRNWPGKDDWARAKKAEGFWKDSEGAGCQRP